MKMNNIEFNPYEIDFIYMDRDRKKPALHTHHRYELFYFHRGRCNYLVGNHIYDLEPGDILLMNGMTLHSPRIDPNFEYVRSVVHFDHESIKPFLQSFHSLNILKPFQEFSHCRLSLQGNKKEEVEQILSRMAQFFERKDRIHYNRFRLHFIDLLYFVYEHYHSVQSEQMEMQDNKENIVQQIITYIEKSYSKDISLDMLETDLYMNKHYLSKLFKQITGKTIMSYLYEYRIKEAQKMFLLNKNMSVTTVCNEVGFKHLSHFSRLFKQYTRMSPDTFRRGYEQYH